MRTLSTTSKGVYTPCGKETNIAVEIIALATEHDIVQTHRKRTPFCKRPDFNAFSDER